MTENPDTLHRDLITIESRPEGLHIKCGDKEHGPFKDINEIDVFKVAQLFQTEPKKVFEAKLRFYSASKGLEDREGKEGLEAAAEVGDTFTYTGDRPFIGRIQVVALGSPQSRYLTLAFKCVGSKSAKEDCISCPLDQAVTINFNDPTVDHSAFANYFDTNNHRDALSILVERGLKPECSSWWKATTTEGKEERAVTQAVVMDRRGIEGKAWFVHGQRCDLKRGPNWIVAEGWLCKGKLGRIGVLVQAFTTESEVAQPSLEEVTRAKATLAQYAIAEGSNLEESVVYRIADSLKRHSQLKGNEVHKGYVSDLLTVAGPICVKTPEGEPQLGPTTCELGPTTTAKSQRQRELIKWLGAGKYETGRKTPAGLTAGAEKTEGGWVVRKGLLPSMDLSYLVVDNMPPHMLDDQIESRRNGVVSYTSIKGSAELWARCRLKILNNPYTPFDEHMQKCVALKMFDAKLIARFAFAVFTYGVSTEERYNPQMAILSRTDMELLDAAKTLLRWNLSQERTYIVQERLWPLIMSYGRQLEEAYGNEDIPLYLRANPYKLSVLASSFSLLEGGEEATEQHIALAYEWLDRCAKDIELDEYTALWKKQHELSPEDYSVLQQAVEQTIQDDVKEHGGSSEETTIFRLVEYVARNEKGQRDEIAAYAEKDPKTITKYANVLKGLQVLRSDKSGYHFTPKGVRFFKRWFLARTVPFIPSISSVSERSQDTECDAASKNLSETDSRSCVLPQSGVIRDIEGVAGREHRFVRLVKPTDGICELCGSQGTLTHSFFLSGNRRFACEHCAGDNN